MIVQIHVPVLQWKEIDISIPDDITQENLIDYVHEHYEQYEDQILSATGFHEIIDWSLLEIR